MRIIFFILSLFLLISFSVADPNECIEQDCSKELDNCFDDTVCTNAYDLAENCGFTIPCLKYAFKKSIDVNHPVTELLNCAIQCIA